MQEEKREVGAEYAAFARLGGSTTESTLLLRALQAASFLGAQEMRAPADTVAALRATLLRIVDHPEALEEALLEERLKDFLRNLGPDHPVTDAGLGGRTVEGAVASLRARSVLATQERAEEALNGSGIPADDPALVLARAILPAYTAFNQT